MAEPTTAEQLVAQYELPESDPVVEETPAAPVRNDKGQFVKAEAPAPAEPAKPTHNPFTLRLALDAGISQAEIDSFSPDALEAVVRREYQSARTESTRRAAESREVPRDVPAEFTGETVKPISPAADEFKLDIKDDQYDEPIVRALRQVEKLTKDIAELRAGQAEVRGHLQTQANLTVQQQMDQWFGQKAERYGAGTRADLADDGPDLRRRMALVQLASQIQKKGEPIARTLARADEILYGSAPTAPKPEAPEVTPREREWAEGGVARPTQQVPTEEPKGKRRATQKVAEALREQRGSLNGADEYRDLAD